MQPWNAHNWVQWKHQFQIWLATIGQLADPQKIILFLDCLGPDGLAIVCKLFPQLVNFKFIADSSITFAQVWWQFNEYCWARYSTQTETSKDTDADRMRLQQICDEAKEKVSFILFRLVDSCS